MYNVMYRRRVYCETVCLHSLWQTTCLGQLTMFVRLSPTVTIVTTQCRWITWAYSLNRSAFASKHKLTSIMYIHKKTVYTKPMWAPNTQEGGNCIGFVEFALVLARQWPEEQAQTHCLTCHLSKRERSCITYNMCMHEHALRSVSKFLLTHLTSLKCQLPSDQPCQKNYLHHCIVQPQLSELYTRRK